ncbi:hypothetical protein GJ496_007269 [Pomphorhynchus laevis]|nr:hypothetical protein GJ496_007269 [Pomphorhynchus laevis]
MVPLGPTNSVAVLQLVMTEIINQNKLENTFVYIDVVVVAGTTLDEHDRNLRLFQLLPGYMHKKKPVFHSPHNQYRFPFKLVFHRPQQAATLVSAIKTFKRESTVSTSDLDPKAYGDTENDLPVNHANDGNLDCEVGALSINNTNHMSTHAQSSTDLSQSQKEEPVNDQSDAKDPMTTVKTGTDLNISNESCLRFITTTIKV